MSKICDYFRKWCGKYSEPVKVNVIYTGHDHHGKETGRVMKSFLVEDGLELLGKLKIESSRINPEELGDPERIALEMRGSGLPDVKDIDTYLSHYMDVIGQNIFRSEYLDFSQTEGSAENKKRIFLGFVNSRSMSYAGNHSDSSI